MRTSMACNVAPIFIRLAIGITFLWAGLGKFMVDAEFTGEDARYLQSLRDAPASTERPDDPDATIPEDLDVPPADETPATEEAPDDTPVETPDDAPGIDLTSDGDTVTAKRVMGLAVTLHKANQPGADEDGEPKMQLWPDAFAMNGRTVWFAWAVAVTEVLGGAFCLLGLLTRLSAFCLTGVCLGMLWFTQFGPAMQSGSAVLGFLPDHAVFDTEAWAKPLWQLSLLMMSLALLFSGAGRLSIDALLLGGGSDDDGE